MTEADTPERRANEAAIAAIYAVPPERVGRAKVVLIESALVLVLAVRLSVQRRSDLHARIAAVLPDLAALLDEPIAPVVGAARELLQAAPGMEVSLRDFLRLVLMDYYVPRAAASYGRWHGQAGGVGPRPDRMDAETEVIE